MLKLKLLVFVENGNYFHINLISHVSRFFNHFKSVPQIQIFVSHVMLHDIFRSVYQNLS
jgi:sulfur relay (sulfurtransferase) DsrC/TusE family protein